MNNLINWLEIPATDIDRATAFYQQIFGIELQRTEMMGMKMAIFPHGQNDVSGTLIQGEGYKPGAEGPLVYLNSGNDLQQILDKIETSGGKVVMPKTQISPEHGNFAIFIDSEGNRMALHSMN